MNSRQTSRHITFRHPFMLAGMSEPHAAGTFELLIEEVPLDVSWEAHRLSCRLMLVDGASTSAFPVTLAELEAALLADAQHDQTTGFS
jgi:hypothetical protein